MLILTRKTDEQILIGDDIKITLVRVRGNSVRIGIDAPRDIRVVRSELKSLDSKPNDQVNRPRIERQQVLAHPQAKVISGRVTMPNRESTSAETNANDPIHQATTPHMFVGRVSTEGALTKRDRTPLGGFVSAT